MKLDSTAMESLDIFPNDERGLASRCSLFSFLNRCITSQGSRLLNQWLRQPLVQESLISTKPDTVHDETLSFLL
jgi:DNA mismatch repair protein MSH2